MTSPPARKRPAASRSPTSSKTSPTKAAPKSTAPARPRSAATSTPPARSDAIIKLTENSACSSQLEAAGPLPLGELEKAKGELTGAVKKAHVDVYVGDDNIIRKVAAELTIEPKGSSSEKVEVEFELSLGGVNEEQKISAPSGAKPLEGAVPASSASTRSNCSKPAAAAAPASAACSKAWSAAAPPPGAGPRRAARAAPAARRPTSMPQGREDAGRPAEVRQPGPVAAGAI